MNFMDSYISSLVYFLFLKMTLNMKQMIAKMIPIVASKKNITVNAIDTVTISSFGTPSYGLPSSMVFTPRENKNQSIILKYA